MRWTHVGGPKDRQQEQVEELRLTAGHSHRRIPVSASAEGFYQACGFHRQPYQRSVIGSFGGPTLTGDAEIDAVISFHGGAREICARHECNAYATVLDDLGLPRPIADGAGFAARDSRRVAFCAAHDGSDVGTFPMNALL